MSNKDKNGFFVVLDGIDGSSKSTQVKLVAEVLKTMGYDVIETREPGGSIGAEEIRNLVVNGAKDRWDSITELLLFSAARRNHVETVIKPALAQGKIVLCDRFVPSTVAYQGYGHGVDLDVIDTVTKIAIGDFKPDLLLILTIDQEEGLRRINQRKGTEVRFESLDLEFHQRVVLGYENISKTNTKTGNKYSQITGILNTAQKDQETVDDCISRITDIIVKGIDSIITINNYIVTKNELI